jgi:16S rRNA (adenine1518-N6/adenine1519-N6)-dimethyltransferase
MRHLARKRFGQHFLVDPFVIGAIVDAIAPRPGDAMVEIGPGLGAMTSPLATRCELLTVIELDRDLPYNISTPILFHLLAHVDSIADQHFMLQKEVVDRMAAAPGSKTYGRLSVMLQWRYAIDALLDVPPAAFKPPPRVDSAVVRMRPLPAAPDVDAALLGEIVTVAFSQRRKVLRNTLGRWLEAHAFEGEFDLARRAEEVPVAEYLALVRELAASR